MLKTNPFGSQLCPTGGLRSHCPNKGNCLYMHRDDNKHHIVKAQKNTEDNLSKQGFLNDSYKKRLRGWEGTPAKTDMGADHSYSVGEDYIMQQNIFPGATYVTTPRKGGGLLGIARSIRRTPAKSTLSDPDDLISSPIEISTVQEIYSTPPSPSSASKPSNKDVCGDGADISEYKSIRRGKYSKFFRQKLYNLNGVYGERNQYIATALKNPGNSCYLNSVLQSLSNSEQLVSMLLSINKEEMLMTQTGTVFDELRFIMKILKSGEYKHITPNDFKRSVEIAWPQFEGDRQHDAHELLTCILDSLKMECAVRIPHAKMVFEGTYESRITCSICGTPSTPKEEPFNSLQIEIKRGMSSIQSGLEDILESDNIEDWNCPSCKVKCPASKHIIIKQTPEMLILHLKRFTYDKHGFSKKNSKEVLYSPVIEINESEYHLSSVINHLGHTDGGHYTSFCQENVSGRWYSYNDKDVTEIDVSETHSKNRRNAYILFYQKAKEQDKVSKVHDETLTVEPPLQLPQENIMLGRRERMPSRKLRESQEQELSTKSSSDKTSKSKANKSCISECRESLHENCGDSPITKETDVTSAKSVIYDESAVHTSQVEDAAMVCCVCKKSNTSDVMIECEKCNEWFHTKRISYMCVKCDFVEKVERKELTKYKEKIRELEEANKALQKEEVKQKKAKSSEEMMKKKCTAELEESKAKIKDLEKKLSAKNKSLDTMTVDCQKALKELKIEKSKVESLESRVSEMDVEIKDLQIENKTHKEAMQILGEAGINKDQSPNEKEEGSTCCEECESLKKQLEMEKEVCKKLKASHSSAMKEKNAEIRVNKAAVEVVESKLSNTEGEVNKLKLSLDAGRLENGRLVDINDLLSKQLKERNNSIHDPDKIVGSPEITHEASVVHPPGSKNLENKSDRKEKAVENCTGGKSQRPKDVVEQGKKAVCHNLFMKGNCTLPGCDRRHKTNLTKIKRGMCVYEFSLESSCPWGTGCMYTHDFPPEVCRDKNIIEQQRIKFNEVTNRKTNRAARIDDKRNVNDDSVSPFNHLGGSTFGQHCENNETIDRKINDYQDFRKPPPPMLRKPWSNQNVSPTSFTQINRNYNNNNDKSNTRTNNKDHRPWNDTRNSNIEHQDNRKISNGTASNIVNGTMSANLNGTMNAINSETSFLELIRPMIMDQIAITVQECMNSHMNNLQNLMSSQLTLV